MIKVGKTIILNEKESLYKGDCTADVVNKAHNIISIDSNTGEISLLKIKDLNTFLKRNSNIFGIKSICF